MARMAGRFDIEQRYEGEANERHDRAQPCDRCRNDVKQGNEQEDAPHVAKHLGIGRGIDQAMAPGRISPMRVANHSREAQIDAVNRRGQRELVVSPEQRSRKRHEGDGQEKDKSDPKVHAVGADDEVQLHVVAVPEDAEDGEADNETGELGRETS